VAVPAELRHGGNKMMDNLPTILLGAGGLTLGVGSFVRDVRARTSRHHYDRAAELYDLLDKAEARGPLTGSGASTNSESAHRQLIATLEFEARAHTVLHAERVGRLSRPGSYIVAAIAVVYAFVTASLAGNALATLLLSPFNIGNAVAAGIGVLSTASLAATGIRTFLRRCRTRELRQRSGLVDPVSVEGVTVITSGITTRIRSWRRHLQGVATES
jgi:hypothetical protein